MHDMELPPSVKAIGRAGAGVNNIPVERMSAAGIPVFNAPGANANAVKELVIAGMLLACPDTTVVLTGKPSGSSVDRLILSWGRSGR